MSTSTGLTIINSSVTSLQDYLSTALPILIPIMIAVAVLFAGIFVLKGLWHRKV